MRNWAVTRAIKLFLFISYSYIFVFFSHKLLKNDFDLMEMKIVHWNVNVLLSVDSGGPNDLKV